LTDFSKLQKVLHIKQEKLIQMTLYLVFINIFTSQTSNFTFFFLDQTSRLRKQKTGKQHPVSLWDLNTITLLFFFYT